MNCFEKETIYSSIKKSTTFRDFPDGPVVKKLSPNAGDVGSIPGPGTEIPHDTEKPSPCTATTEAV